VGGTIKRPLKDSESLGRQVQDLFIVAFNEKKRVQRGAAEKKPVKEGRKL